MFVDYQIDHQSRKQNHKVDNRIPSKQGDSWTVTMTKRQYLVQREEHDHTIEYREGDPEAVKSFRGASSHQDTEVESILLRMC